MTRNNNSYKHQEIRISPKYGLRERAVELLRDDSNDFEVHTDQSSNRVHVCTCPVDFFHIRASEFYNSVSGDENKARNQVHGKLIDSGVDISLFKDLFDFLLLSEVVAYYLVDNKITASDKKEGMRLFRSWQLMDWETGKPFFIASVELSKSWNDMFEDLYDKGECFKIERQYDGVSFVNYGIYTATDLIQMQAMSAHLIDVDRLYKEAQKSETN